MAEPSTTAVLPAATGLTLLGVATGIDPGLLFAGLAGGWWALSYAPEPMALSRRLTVGAISALAGAWAAPPSAALLAALAAQYVAWWPAEAGAVSLRYVAAMAVGLMAHRSIGPGLLRKVDEALK
jgi:hypothetical protein